MGHRRALAALAVALVSCGDNVHPGGGTLIVSPQLGLFTDESGSTATFTIAMSNAPETDVVVDLTSMDDTEGRVSPRTLIFDAQSFARAQTVTITGVDDLRADGDRAYVVRIGSDHLGTIDLDVINGDDDLAGARITPLVGLMTSEGGTQAAFTVALTSEPSATVTVPLSSSDASEGTASATQLTFFPEDWDVPQTVTVSGAQDADPDGAVPYTIVLGAVVSADVGYNSLDFDDVQVVNVDDDVQGIAVTPASGLQTAEAGTPATFAVVLQTQPANPVTIAVSSSDTTEATASTAQLVFTTTTWNVAQTVTVTGADDAVDDGNQPFTIVLGAASSTDAAYNGVDPADVTGTNTDDDTAGIAVTPTTGLITTEGGGTDAFTVQLQSEPTGTVAIAVTSSDTTEGTAAPATLTFTAANWSSPQTVTVTGVNDTLSDTDQTYAIRLALPVTTDAKYAAIDPADVTVSNTDNDIPGFTIDPLALEVSEFRDADQFSIVLNTAPTANVTISFTSTDTTEGTALPASVTFTPQDWDTPQFVAVTGADDTTADGDIVFSIITAPATSGDAAYNGLDPTDIAVTNFDNDSAQVYVKARRRLFVSESGQSTTFRVSLTVQPTATVTCTLTSTDTGEGMVSPTTLVFQPNNFGFRTVTVLGIDDQIADGDQLFTVVLNECTSTDLAYQGSNPRDVAVINRDND